MKTFLAILVFVIAGNSATLHFDTYKKGNGDGHTLLVIGGIHGDEPGGYFAPAVLIKHYQISHGNLWIVPNLNFDSIIKNKRGIYGDMNRKFDTIAKTDKDYKIVQDIKTLIQHPKVDLLLNLHDGHGFYRKSWESAIFNPGAWGQTCIIDQKVLNINSCFKNLDEIASRVSTNLNKSSLEKEYHNFRVKNTKTKDKDEQMQLSLTYFAVTHDKPAFAIETSKNLTELARKVQYQLRAIEEYLKVMGIQYKRDFNLDDYDEVKRVVNDLGTVKLNNQMTFNLNNLKTSLSYVPLKPTHNIASFTHPLGILKNINDNYYSIFVGNKHVVTLYPQRFRIDTSLDRINIQIDGKDTIVDNGTTVSIQKQFKIDAPEQYRVNIIGYTQKGHRNENGLAVSVDDVLKRYAIDNSGYLYRVEFYNDDAFSGMLVIDFTPTGLKEY